MNERFVKKRWPRVAASLVLLLVALAAAGCDKPANAPEQTEAEPAEASGEIRHPPENDWKPYEARPGEKVELTVMYASEASFYRDYGNLFLARHPEAEFRVVALSETRGEGDMLANYEAVLKESAPDVLLLNEAQYEALAANGRLLDLDAPIRSSGFDMESMVPGVIELLTERGGGRLYGLSPSFESRALYYNRSLFDEYGVPYPEPGMSWEEVLMLAERFPDANEAGQPLYGLYQPTFTISPFDLAMKIGSAQRLSLLDPEGAKLLLDSEGWKRIFSLVVEGYKNQAIYYPAAPLRDNGNGTTSLSLGSNLFLDGQAAMAIDDMLMMQMMDFLAGRKGENEGESAAFAWDTVPMPVSPDNPGVTPYFEVEDIFAVNRESDQLSLAWEFVQYVHSEEFMTLSAKSSSKLLSRTGFEQDSKGRDLSDFYALQPDLTMRTPLVPKGFTRAFRDIAEKAITDAIADRMTTDEALAYIREEAQKTLNAAVSSGNRERFALDEELL
ncbi:extracellular solute-binding protein [Cohnella algarum]|uniref:extracellular solute-binding protein n=1 Tax=Cohnella algarum TaxID=2044859 RepID=UPI0019674731|nr:extracellular solute-binding protein [Cohnella algarum]MBN2981940.1 extracellular solute-binding protein [Cohnella algarum]